MMIKNTLLFFSFFLFTVDAMAQEKEQKKITHDFEVELEASYTGYFDDASFSGQKDNFPSFAIRPEYSVEWNDGYESINFQGFFRLDVDNERTHWDIRELYYQKVKGNWELSIGLKKVYWGVTESNHLVDIINQTDAIESFDREQKLGQPMVQYSLNTNFGTFDLFYLPYHRKRTFAGEKGRFRFPIIIDKDDVGYESSAKEWRQDFAFRYSQSWTIFDLGLSHFYGTGREPFYEFDVLGNINAFYPVINQTGLDFQVTHNAFLWKLESIYRSSKSQDFLALVAGLEFTISNIKNSGIDVGLIGEYLYDERDELALNALQNDVFFGSRIAFNDVQSTEILLGGIADLNNSSKIFSVEASRRFGESLKIEIEGRLFSNIATNELILSNFKNDSFFRISLFKYF
ncbi:FIG01201466: hypothetical protein [hydrothermal vent metagenome]|uniref:Porin n=1 Tax=hydrothermal vent metagenome TaxID=652676 RepID=A0A3B0T553_9ZZZZ